MRFPLRLDAKLVLTYICFFICAVYLSPCVHAQGNRLYEPRGVGGGGAMSGFSMSPYSKVWFVGTDMGTLFRSTNEGMNWYPVAHDQTTFSETLQDAAPVGFCKDPRVMFHAPGGQNPVRSRDQGVTWTKINIGGNWRRIRYWLGDSSRENFIYAATDNGLLRSIDKGMNWKQVTTTTDPHFGQTNHIPTCESRGTFIDYKSNGQNHVYHATPQGIFRSRDNGQTFSIYHPAKVRWFAGGRDGALSDTPGMLTLAYVDFGSFDSRTDWVNTDLPTREELIPELIRQKDEIDANNGDEPRPPMTYSELIAGERATPGVVWTEKNGLGFNATKNPDGTLKEGGSQILMAENDARVIYVVGHPNWKYAFGTQVWISTDAGNTFKLQFKQSDPDGNNPWPTLQKSAVGLDIGWHDSGYHWFAVNQQASRLAGGSQNYFLHVTRNKGQSWESPFTSFPPGQGARAEKKRWASTGIEVVSIRKLKFHPHAPQFGYACGYDRSALVTVDRGKTWRIAYPRDDTPGSDISKHSNFNRATYDVAFNASDTVTDTQTLYAAFGADHDWPHDWHANPYLPASSPVAADGTRPLEGGIAKSENRGMTWRRLGANDPSMHQQFLSVAYDADSKTLYAGSQGSGIARQVDDGSWQWINKGLGQLTESDPQSYLIIPQIEIDPVNGDVYALLTGDYGVWTNQNTTGIYKMPRGGDQWIRLRGTLQRPSEADPSPIHELWYYPTSFAIDFSLGSDRKTMFLTDIENKGQWKSTGVWRTKDGGNNWECVTQATFPFHVLIDPLASVPPDRPQRIYASGGHKVDGTRLKGGAMYSDSGGDLGTWVKNDQLPLQSNIESVTPDPNDANSVFYTFFGGSMMHGPRPPIIRASASNRSITLVFFTGALDAAVATGATRYSVKVKDGTANEGTANEATVGINSATLPTSKTVELKLAEGPLDVGDIVTVGYNIRDAQGHVLSGKASIKAR